MKLLWRESMVAIAYEDTIIEHGALNKTVTDNPKALVIINQKKLSIDILLVQVIQYHTISTNILLKEKTITLNFLFANTCTTNLIH